jgi:hypothetical protein
MKRTYLLFLYLIFITGIFSCNNDIETQETFLESEIQTKSATLPYPLSTFVTVNALGSVDTEALNDRLEILQLIQYRGKWFKNLFKYASQSSRKISRIERAYIPYNALAAYDYTTRTIKFSPDNSYLGSSAFDEEFLHYIQDMQYVGGLAAYVNHGRPNIEFEAKLIQDCIGCCSTGTSFIGRGLWYYDYYEDWIYDLVNTQNPNFPSQNSVMTKKVSNLGYYEFMADYMPRDPSLSGKTINSTLRPEVLNYVYLNQTTN